jgi:hypothetical protein
MNQAPPANPPSNSRHPSIFPPQFPRITRTRSLRGGHANWPIANHRSNSGHAWPKLLQTRTSYPQLHDNASLATMMMHFIDESLMTPFHQQWQTVAAPLMWVRLMTPANARASPPTKSSYSLEARSWLQLKSQSTHSKCGTLLNSSTSRLASP